MNTILVIEDEPQIRETIQDILELRGFAVVTAKDGYAGLRLAREVLPDLILCDVMMPELDGYDVVRELRQDLETANIPFIFLTALADRPDMRRGMELGADDYLTKPFELNELLRTIAVRLKKQALSAQKYTSQIQKLETALEYLAHHDTLTQLPNQLMLQDQFGKLHAGAIAQGRQLPLLLLSIDQYPLISQTLGHAFANAMLKLVGNQLLTYANQHTNQVNLVAHLAGDHFVVLLQPTADPDRAIAVAQALLEMLAAPITVNNHEVMITASIGIATSLSRTAELSQVLTQAEAAMHQPRRKGGNAFQVYDPSLQSDSLNRLTLEANLRQALACEEFQLYYQPQLDLHTGQITGAEALLRWPQPDGSFISPAQFIPIAEETGLIVPLGEWVLRTACQQIKAWQSAGLNLPRMAVNLSTRQLRQLDLSQTIAQILQETNLAPNCLELELTESVLMQDADTAIVTLNHLKSLGVYISIDDFGTGYSSLSYLHRFTFTTLKIDRCFIHHLPTNTGNQAIVTAMIQMAHELNLRVVAEGVETEAELNWLSQYHCDLIQGFLFSRPLAAADFVKLAQGHTPALLPWLKQSAS